MADVTYGYRSELPFGDGRRDSVSVVRHEIFELGNDDIMETLVKTILKGQPEEKEINEMIERHRRGEYNQLDRLQQRRFVGMMLNAVARVTGKRVNAVLWLCKEKDDVYRYDLNPSTMTDDDIDTYPTSDVILSDCGEDGCLYAYEDLPDKISR
jgi:hypothetical protein